MNLPVHAFGSRAQGFSTPLARRQSTCPPPSSNLVRTHPIEHYQVLCDSASCLSRTATPPEGHQIEAPKRCAPGKTILNQPYRRRVSTDRLKREGSQLAASFEGEPGPTSAGKTLPHSYTETRFRRERVRPKNDNNNNNDHAALVERFQPSTLYKLRQLGFYTNTDTPDTAHQLDAKAVVPEVVYIMTNTQPSCSGGGGTGPYPEHLQGDHGLLPGGVLEGSVRQGNFESGKHGVFNLIPIYSGEKEAITISQQD